MASEAEEGKLQVFLELSASKIRITVVHLIGKKNGGRKELWEVELSFICTWGAEMIATSGQQRPVGNWKGRTRTHVRSLGGAEGFGHHQLRDSS